MGFGTFISFGISHFDLNHQRIYWVLEAQENRVAQDTALDCPGLQKTPSLVAG